jgi:septal ring factor EnvC (AmiA/AmiB activator)
MRRSQLDREQALLNEAVARVQSYCAAVQAREASMRQWEAERRQQEYDFPAATQAPDSGSETELDEPTSPLPFGV